MNNYGDIGNATAGYYFRQLLRHAMPVLILERFAQAKVLPRNETKIAQFRRSKAFGPATIPLTEGVPPQGSDFGYDTITVQIQQYGDYSEITDVIQDLSKDNVPSDISKRQGEQIGETRELLTWDVVRAGTNRSVPTAGRTGVTKTFVLTSARQRTETTALAKQKGKKFTEVMAGSEDYDTSPIEAAYVAVAHTDLDSTIRDLNGTTARNEFVPTSKYGRMGVISPHELGSFENVRYVTSPDLPPFSGGGGAVANTTDEAAYYFSGVTGSGKYDVYPILYLAMDAYGCIALRTQRTRDGMLAGRNVLTPSVLLPNTPRGGDPLGQKGSIGWKMYFACVILNDAWMRRLEVACAK